MDFSKLKPSDWLLGGGTAVFLIAMFLPWYKAEVDGFGGGSVNGWEYFLFGIIPLLLLIAATVAAVVPKLADGVKVPENLGPLPKAQAVLIAAGLAALLVLLRILIKDDGDVPSILEDEIDISRGFGLILGFLAAAAAAAGAFMKFQDKEEIGAGPSSAPPTPF